MPSYENMIQITTPCCSQTLHQATHLTIQVPKEQFLHLVKVGFSWQHSRITDTGHVCSMQFDAVAGSLHFWTELTGEEMHALPFA